MKSVSINAMVLGLLAASIPMSAFAANNAVLEEIVVTAQKREQGLQEVPISVASMSDDAIAAMFSGGDDILALAARVPGLYAESSNGRGAPRFYIRGLGNVDFDLAASQPVSVIMDDVVMENVTFKSFPLFDVDRVEVIRGPQGTLFGRNTTAGIVKFDTARPTAESDGYASISGGSFGTVRFEGALGGTLVEDTLTGRISVLHNSRDDWVSNAFTGETDSLGGYDETALRLQGQLQVTEDLTALLSFQTRELDGSASIFRANVFTTGQEGLNANYDRDLVFYDDGGGNPQDIDTDTVSLKFEYVSGDLVFTSITAYQETDYAAKGDIDGGFVDFVSGASGPGFIPFGAVTEDQAVVDQLTQEFRLAGTAPNMNWQVGAFFYDSDLAVTTIDGFFGTTTVNHTNSAWAVFGQVAYDVSDRLTLTGGLRYTDDEKDLTVGQQNVNGFALVIGAASIQTYAPVSVSDDQLSWEASANYQLQNDASVYARLSDGFRAQSIQARDVAFEGLPSVADSETITSFEVGYKADFADNRARLNAAWFYYEVDDLQLSAIGGANNGNSLLNADQGTGSGIELDFEWLASDNLLLTAGYGYASTEIEDPNLETAICGSGACTVLDPTRTVAGTTFANINGNPFQAAPESTFNFTVSYSIPVRSGEVHLYTDWAWQGDTQMSLYDAVEFKTDGQYEGGLRVAYRNDSVGYEVGLFGRNITNEDNIKGFIDFNNNTGFVNEPRVWGVDFRYNFFR